MSRFVQNVEAKRAIGRVCCDLIEDGEAIFLDCGTTTHHVAQQFVTDCANDDLRRICAAHEIKLQEASA